MHKYKVLSDAGIVLDGVDDTIHAKDSILELDSSNEQVAALLANNSIELVVDVSPVMIDYVVMNSDGVAKESGEIFQKGNVIQFEEGSEDAAALVLDKSIIFKSEFDTLPKDQTSPTTPEVAQSSVPKYYRDQLVIEDTHRTVEGITYHHIALGDGTRYDLTDKEYEDEVKLTK